MAGCRAEHGYVVQAALEAAIIFLIISLLFGRFETHSVSMEPGLKDELCVLVSKLDLMWPNSLIGTAESSSGYSSSPFARGRGQMAVFFNNSSRAGVPLVKRAVGLPGDAVEVRGGRVLVNGRSLDEPYVNGQLTLCSRHCGPITLGPDQYFFSGRQSIQQ